MKKLDLGQTITILANVGVIVGIVVLVIELQQNTLAVQSEARQGLQDQIQAVYEMADERLLEIFLKSDEDPTSLTPVEIARINIYITVASQAYQNLYFQVRSGAIDAEQAEGWWQDLRQALEGSVWRAAWEQRGYILSQEFRDFVDDQVLTLEVLQGASFFELQIE